MKKLLQTIALLITLVCLPFAVYADEAVPEVKYSAAVDEIFARGNIDGTLVMYDTNANACYTHNAERAAQRFYPASTFKIFNSLIGLNVHAVKNVDEYFYKYTGEPVYLESWQNDANLRLAIKRSQVPAYKELARRIGRPAMQANLNLLQYGNMEIGEHLDSFWLQGPLKISALEQVQLLTYLAQQKLPYDKSAQAQVAAITVLQQNKNYTLHGKTGWATENIDTPVGWFVGWVEAKDNTYVFALNMDLQDANDLPLRESLTLDCLKALKAI